MDQRPKYNNQNYKALRRNYNGRFYHIGLSNDFLNVTPNTQATKEKETNYAFHRNSKFAYKRILSIE